MYSRAGAAVHVFRGESCRRPDAVYCRDNTLRFLCGFFWNDGGRSNSKSGRGLAGRRTRWVPARFSSFGSHISRRQHPGKSEMAVALRLGEILHRDCARRAIARRWLAGYVAKGAGHRCHRCDLLRGRVGKHATHAAEGIITMRSWIKQIFSRRVRALTRKEFSQIRRDRRLAIFLVLPPTLQLLLFGFALNADVTNLRLGVVDESKTAESRELIATLTQSKSFRLAGYYLSLDQLGVAMNQGDLDAGIVVPYDCARDLQRGRVTTLQVLLDAMNANTAAIGQGYAEGVIQSYNRGLAEGGLHVDFRQISAPEVSHRGEVILQPAFLYNPGLVDSWFIATGVFGLL